MYLVDTNIWLERLLNQEKSGEVAEFLDRTDSAHLSITDFSFHSIGVILTRLRTPEALLSFTRDVFGSGVGLIRLEPADTRHLVEASTQFHLDYDDAYQYVAIQKYAMTLISFDADFDRTPIRRKLPHETQRQ